MLKLRKVELQGFKSFCDRTELRFNGGGIAAVVGPNGCGKSNLSDAISWVLGEQSARSLRGARMEDVIFAGTKTRKPVGMASVTMVLVDPEAKSIPPTEGSTGPDNVHEIHSASGHSVVHHPGAKASEITVTRRLYRSGESEYLIDGRQARLRDIQDIFMGSGLGPESYAIIEQGRIGQILSSKPQDRRAVIEEAAGISKYKSRRRLAEARLESSKQNLSRVFDILEEVTRQVNSLKRQAAKARRYQELKAELESQLRTVLAGRYIALKDELAKVSVALEKAAAELTDATTQAADKDTERQRLQEVFYSLEAQLTDARAQLAETNLEAERTRGRLESQVREAANIEQPHERALTKRPRNSKTPHPADASNERAALARKPSGELEQEMQEVRAGLMEKNQARDAIQSRVREAGKAPSKLRALGHSEAAWRSVERPEPDRAGGHVSGRNRAGTRARPQRRRDRGG